MVVTYVAVLVALNKYAINDLNALRLTFGDLSFWLAVAAPLICSLLFSMVPTLWRALRERHLKAGIIEGDQQFKAGYFRLYAYGEADSEEFKRLDGAGNTVFHWLRSTRASPLYLSGASGVGKSSLLAADLLPKLRNEGWAVVEVRLFADPVERLKAAVLRRHRSLRQKTPCRSIAARSARKSCWSRKEDRHCTASSRDRSVRGISNSAH
jgi:hypothetical protein